MSRDFFCEKQFDFLIVPQAKEIYYFHGVKLYPTTMIIDKSGKFAKIHKGSINEDELEKMKQQIESLLGE